MANWPLPCHMPTALSQLVAVDLPNTNAALIEASGLVFRLDSGEPATYCPSEVGSQCPPGTETDFSCQDGYCGLVCLLQLHFFCPPLSQTLLICLLERRSARWPADLRRSQRRRQLHSSSLRLRSTGIILFRILAEWRGISVWGRQFLRLSP